MSVHLHPPTDGEPRDELAGREHAEAELLGPRPVGSDPESLVARPQGAPIDPQTLRVVERRRAPGRKSRRRGRLIRRLLTAGDLFAMLACVALIESLQMAAEVPAAERASLYAAAALGLLGILGVAGLYGADEVRADHTTPDDIPAIARAVGFGGFLACAAAWGGGAAAIWLPVIFSSAIALAILLPLGRAVARTVARRQPGYVQQTLILGAGDIGQLMARKLVQHPEYGLAAVGFLDDAPRPLAADVRHVPVLGGIADIGRVTREHGIERVIVAFSGVPHAEILDVIRTLKQQELQIDIVPRLFEVVGPNVGVTSIEGVPMVVLPPLHLARSHLAVKRSLDVVVAATALALLAPVFLAIAAVLRLEGRGPLLYAGVRVGRGGRLFRQLKFRTMRPEFCDGPGAQGLRAAEAFEALLDRSPALRDEFALTQKLTDDPRVTRVGRFLRRTSLDELPQFWNVLRGDLSLVGPRPVTEGEMRERYRPRILAPDAEAAFLIGYWDSPGLRPGLTGYWQISGRSTMSFDERVRLDTAYLTSWSLGLDLQILAKTVRVVVGARGAY